MASVRSRLVRTRETVSETKIAETMRRLVIFVAFCLSTGILAQPSQIAAVVVSVSDGDTLWVQQKSLRMHIRLFGIDCPEIGQHFGEEAKQLTATKSLGKRVSIEIKDTDNYGRFVSRVRIDGEDLSLALVSAGLAWYYRQFTSDANLEAGEGSARKSRIGLWREPSPVAPWDFRRAETRPPPTESNGSLHGNMKSKVYHLPGCRDYDCANCSTLFATPTEATAAGFRKHLGCPIRREPE